MELVNLTPHVLNVIGSDKEITEIPLSGHVARVEMTREEADSVGQISLWQSVPGKITGIENLPLKGGKEYIFITSLVAKRAVLKYLSEQVQEGFEDSVPPTIIVVSPGELVRNEAGQPIGCQGLDW